MHGPALIQLIEEAMRIHGADLEIYLSTGDGPDAWPSAHLWAHYETWHHEHVPGDRRQGLILDTMHRYQEDEDGVAPPG